MIRRAQVFVKGRCAGMLEEIRDAGRTRYRFAYDPVYLADSHSASVSLTLPKRLEPYEADTVFPFFYGLLAEGAVRKLQCRVLRLDERDHLGRLLRTAATDCIGAVTVREVEVPPG